MFQLDTLRTDMIATYIIYTITQSVTNIATWEEDVQRDADSCLEVFQQDWCISYTRLGPI